MCGIMGMRGNVGTLAAGKTTAGRPSPGLVPALRERAADTCGERVSKIPLIPQSQLFLSLRTVNRGQLYACGKSLQFIPIRTLKQMREGDRQEKASRGLCSEGSGSLQPAGKAKRAPSQAMQAARGWPWCLFPPSTSSPVLSPIHGGRI